MEKKEDLGGIEGTYKEEEGPIEKWKDRGRREEGKVRRKSKERGETILLNTKAYLDRRLLHLGPREKVFWPTIPPWEPRCLLWPRVCCCACFASIMFL